MKKNKIISLLLLVFILASCSRAKDTLNSEDKYVISNLNSEKSQADIKDTLEDAGISKEKVDRFINQVNFFNQNVSRDLLIKDDYERRNEIREYDQYAMQDQLFAKYPEFAGINCRITSFGLISDKITVKETKNPNLSAIEIDNSSFINPPVETLNKDEIDGFNKFYSAIKSENKNDPKYQEQKIKDFWKENGIVFPESNKYSIISVYVFSNIDEDNNELFVGHTGILIKLKDSKLMLVEKLAFTSPYQAITFNSYQDLYEYLMKLYDFSNEQYPIKPLIFDNDRRIEI